MPDRRVLARSAGDRPGPDDRSVIFIAPRMAAHAKASGYDRLVDFLPGSRIVPPTVWTLRKRVLARALRFLIKRSGSYWYHRQHLLSELRAAALWLNGGNQLFHFLYGENSYRYLGLLKALGKNRNAIVCSYHTPETRFSEVVRDRRHLARIDAAIVVSSVQTEYMSDIVGPERVFFVPHGIDTEYFHPSEEVVNHRAHFDCLFVGTHLRDFETLASTARLLQDRRNIRFKVVTRAENLKVFPSLKNVVPFSRVDDSQLLKLYQQCHLLVFPLLDCTANNSLLEALACGLPVLTTDLPGVRDYVSPECAVLVSKGDSQALAHAIIGLEQDRDRLQRMASACRQRSLEFRWQRIAQLTRDVYRAVS